MTEPVPLDQACILGHAQPVAREFGFACKRHYTWIDRTLRQIEELFALLEDVLIPGPGGDIRSGTRVGSPAPGRVEVMAITDPRAKTPIDLDDPDDVPDLPGTLASWARLIVEERQTTDTIHGDVSTSVRVLHRERGWISQQRWLDDYAFELAAIHRAVARAVGDSLWPRPIGKCPNDGSPLFNTIGVDEITCRRCRATWTGVHLARLLLIFEQEKAGAR